MAGEQRNRAAWGTWFGMRWRAPEFCWTSLATNDVVGGLVIPTCTDRLRSFRQEQSSDRQMTQAIVGVLVPRSICQFCGTKFSMQ